MIMELPNQIQHHGGRGPVTLLGYLHKDFAIQLIIEEITVELLRRDALRGLARIVVDEAVRLVRKKEGSD
jgi:hypothetical protein